MTLIVLRKIATGRCRVGAKPAKITAQHGMVWRIHGLIRVRRRLFDTRTLAPYMRSSLARFEQGGPIREGTPRKEVQASYDAMAAGPVPGRGAVCPAAVFASNGRFPA